ncbi:MAG: uracil-DNA glycosylase [Pseudomonadales bacterium]|nr:uracil-DNA glycosylase [Pseudomonadales bacterium]HAG97002.1 uracil-DNA glycosylase [Gammaproteobacteria bacterium]MAQ27173.1 uracil-DNA glycosylase [Pseudomonadales bacterium]MBI27006.1 uracil-DNA glycosylase [Pseudomonadales bacterium]HBO94549.1 uracil-DNA glycosylase [Gammaproteobacteria bacterium]
MSPEQIKIEPSWKQHLLPQFQQDYMHSLRDFLVAQKKAGKVIYPKGDEYFNAFNLTPFDRVKVVMIGQDPYHGPGQAHGLCFSVQKGVRFPPSLQNIFKEIHADLGLPIPTNGCLSHWAEQGVLLLNAVLTVEQSKAAAHQGKGWEQFTDAAIRELNEKREGIVFMLWGSYAQKKGQIIDQKKHCVLKAPHPSPLSAHRGFFGCRHFSKANQYLEAKGLTPIDWSVPE